MKLRAVVLLMGFLGVYPECVFADNSFTQFVINAPVATNPLGAGDLIAVIQGGKTRKAAASTILNGLSVSGGNATFPDIATNLSKWTTQIHQNTQTGECYGTGASRVLCASDQNYDLIADHSTIQTQDASLISYGDLGGSATAGDVVGLNWTVASVLYQIRYTVQSGDTLANIGTNLAACINAGTGAHCTVTSGFLEGLLAFHDANGFGYQPRAGMSTTTRMAFDQPWTSSGNSVTAFLSGGATETWSMESNNTLDNGPYMATIRNVPDRTPVASDQLGPFQFQGQSAANSGVDTQYAGLIPRVLVQDATNPQGELIITTADSGSARNNSPKAYFGRGVVFPTAAGVNCSYVGLGVVNNCGQEYVTSATLPQVYWQVPSAVDFQAIIDVPATNNGYLLFRGAGVNLYQLGKSASNGFYIFDVTSGFNAVTLTTGGTLNLGEGVSGGAQISMPKASPMGITGIPTSAGASGLYVCIDNAGILYKKSACP